MSHHVQLAAHLVRRGLAALDQPIAAPPSPPSCNPDDLLRKIVHLDISGAGAAVMLLTVLVFAVLVGSLQYTLWAVVGTLTAIEHPQTVLEVHGGADADANARPSTADADAANIEVAQVKKISITSSIRGTLRHLTARAGWAARWRGLSLMVLYFLLSAAITQLVRSVFSSTAEDALGVVGDAIGSLVAFFALARWRIAWTHIVISEPSPKRWWRRLPGWRAVRAVTLPILAAFAATRVAAVITLFAWMALLPTGREHPAALAGRLLAIFLIAVTCYVLLELPAMVALTRVQASLLPEEDEAIVPFDRSFGGKVQPAIVGGSGALSLRDALATVDAETRNRVLKLTIKVVAIQTAIYVAFTALSVVEAVAFIRTKEGGPDKEPTALL